MSKLSKFLQKPEKIEIETQDNEKIELEMYPLTVDNLDLLMDLESKEEGIAGNALKQIVKLTLKKSMSDATDDEVRNFPIQYVDKLIKAIMKINKVGVSKETLQKAKVKVLGSGNADITPKS